MRASKREKPPQQGGGFSFIEIYIFNFEAKIISHLKRKEILLSSLFLFITSLLSDYSLNSGAFSSDSFNFLLESSNVSS